MFAVNKIWPFESESWGKVEGGGRAISEGAHQNELSMGVVEKANLNVPVFFKFGKSKGNKIREYKTIHNWLSCAQISFGWQSFKFYWAQIEFREVLHLLSSQPWMCLWPPPWFRIKHDIWPGSELGA